MANYPSSHPSLPTNSTNETVSEDAHPALHNNVNAEVNAIASTLGSDPQGDYGSVVERLGGLGDVYLPKSPSGTEEVTGDIAAGPLVRFINDATHGIDARGQSAGVIGQALAAEPPGAVAAEAAVVGIATSLPAFKALGATDVAIDCNGKEIINCPNLGGGDAPVWEDLPVRTGFAQAAIVDGYVMFRGFGAHDDDNLLTEPLPEKFRPPETIPAVSCGDNNTDLIHVAVGADGTIPTPQYDGNNYKFNFAQLSWPAPEEE